MIKITVNKDQSGRIHSFEMTGHAILRNMEKILFVQVHRPYHFGAVNAIISLTGKTPEIHQGSDGGYLSVSLPQSPEDDHDIQLIVKAMIVSLQTIEQDYGQHIKIIFKK